MVLLYHIINERNTKNASQFLKNSLYSDIKLPRNYELIYRCSIFAAQIKTSNTMFNRQIAKSILMVRPKNFGFNPQTEQSNAFQQKTLGLSDEEVKLLALQEFDQFVTQLRQAKIDVLVIEDTEYPNKYDAVFPNNWISTHQSGLIVTYPMFSTTRRLERSDHIFQAIEERYIVNGKIELEYFESLDLFLEGTGSVVLDRTNRIAYACESVRTSEIVLDEFCKKMGYRKMLFQAVDDFGMPIYHTNVMMALGKNFVIICLDSICDEIERDELFELFGETKKNLIVINQDQMATFAGNMLQVENQDGVSYLIMSEQAYQSLREQQIQELKMYTNILYAPLYLIEQYGGGGARCMMAELFLTPKTAQ